MSRKGVVLLSSLVCWGVPASAATYVETTDAGALIGTAVAVGAGVSRIEGRIQSQTGSFVDVDVYRLALPAGAFSARVTSSGPGVGGLDIDTALTLFDGSGLGLRADDDSGDSASCAVCAWVSVMLPSAGTYYLAVFDVVDIDGPFSAAGLIWDSSVVFTENDPPDGPGAGSPWTGWQVFSDPDYVVGDYGIELSPSTVPLPGALPLFASALVGAGLLARGRRRG